MPPYVNPSVGDFQQLYQRDFPFGTELTTITTADITNAMQEAAYFINPALFGAQSPYTLGFLRLSAHFLVLNIRASSQGIAGNWPWMTVSKGVGSVSEGLEIPQRIKDNPEYAMLTKTNYGAQYLFMILPGMSGQMYTVCSQPNA